MRPETRALLGLLDPAPSEHRERRLVALLRGRLNWPRMAAAAQRNECAPFLLFQLRRLELTDLVPAPIVERLSFDYEATALRNGVMVRDFDVANQALQRAGIDALALDEGALMTRSLYPDRGLRPVSRLALSVRAADAAGAVGALEAAGYRRVAAGDEIMLVNERGTRLTLLPEPWAADDEPMALAAGLTSPLDYLAARFTYLAQTEMPMPIRRVDRWFLNVALADHGLRRLRVHVAARRMAEAFGTRRLDPAREAVERRLRRFFPDRDEMVRRHGRHADGLRLYTLYAGRLFSLPGKTAEARRDEPGA